VKVGVCLGCGLRMKYVDAHIHLSDKEYSGCVDEIIVEARNANVVALVSNSMDLETCRRSVDLAEKYPSLVYAALGVHPWTVQTLTENELRQTLELIEANRGSKALVAIGEIGLDSKYEKIWDKQMMVFDEMLHLAERLSLPVVVHSRGTTEKIVDMLPSYKVKRVLLHWFSNPISVLETTVENGYYISEGPPTVFSDGIRDVVRKVPLENLLTETDGPVRFFKKPFEGKRTTPAFIPDVVKAIAEIKNASEKEVTEQIISNFQNFFSMKLN
jgi:TatD DNase family protein